MLKTVQAVQVDQILALDREIEWLPGVEVIHTPGHMPGHISLYIRQNRTMIAADAVVVENGLLEIANPQFTLDLEEAVRSVEKLQQLEIDRIICYHGGVVQTDIPETVEDVKNISIPSATGMVIPAIVNTLDFGLLRICTFLMFSI